MKWLGRWKPAIIIQLVGHLKNIVRMLFPPTLPETVLVVIVPLKRFAEIATDEVHTAARTLPNSKAFGLDGMPNEIMKATALYDPQNFVCVQSLSGKCTLFTKLEGSKSCSVAKARETG